MSEAALMWHQIDVQHNGKIRGSKGKKLLLDAIFKIVDNKEFYPVSYTQGSTDDRFLVHHCQPALDKLYAKFLTLKVISDFVIPLEIQLNAAKFQEGQISPIEQIQIAINGLFNEMLTNSPASGYILNLANFADNSEFADVVINMCNHEVMDRICQITYTHEQFHKVNGLDMKYNDLDNLAGMQRFSGTTFNVLDLRGNQLFDVKGFCDDLQCVRADILLLDGNPIAQMDNYPKCLQPIAKNFKEIDRTFNQYYSINYIQLALGLNGYRVDKSNKSDIYRFQNSSYWHAFIFPDGEQLYSKDDIMENFSNTLPSILSEVYPCYYKYSSGEHKFLMRNSFVQIKFLVEVCNLEIRMRSTKLNDTNNNCLQYYLLMDAQPYSEEQINPIEAIKDALGLRYNHINRSLNLNKFQNTRGLENVVINMKRSKILSRILSIACQGCLPCCVQLDLACNNIKTLKISKKLRMMINVKIVDLGFNCIQSLQDIFDLTVLPICMLRLDGNPICSHYILSRNYRNVVKFMFPSLKMLDNVYIDSVSQLCSEKNFLHTIDNYNFVEMFVPRFFQLYESNNRLKLLELYDKNSTFTLTCNYKQLDRYMRFARNIIGDGNLSQIASQVYHGRDELMKVFQLMPKVAYDLLSFTTDAIVFNQLFTITVTGVFLDQIPQIKYYADKLIAFSRTFVINTYSTKLDISSNTFHIINDQLNLYNASEIQFEQILDCRNKESNQSKFNWSSNDVYSLPFDVYDISKFML